jgi:guanyl-specific ribonuclease Sa
MLRRTAWILIALALFAAWNWWRTAPAPAEGPPPVATADARATRVPASASLPVEAVDTLRRIRAGGPFQYRQDGGVFHNRERLLPQRPSGYYREYTVDTPGERDRGARRIVAGGRPPAEFFYTADHYRSFRRIDADAGAVP